MKFKTNENLFKVTYEGKEGYVVTTKKPTTKNLTWVYRNDEVFQLPDRSKGQQVAMVRWGLEVIASTFPLGDLPQFVIEDENAEDLALKAYYIDSFETLNQPSFIDTKNSVEGFIEGWNKHAEKYEFTKEDMEKAITLAREVSGMEAVVKQLQNEYLNKENFQYTKKEIIQSLQKQKEITEIEFDVEQIGAYANPKYPSDYNLKITKTSEYPNGLLTIKDINYA